MSDLSFYDLTYDGPVVQAILDTAQKLRTDGYIFMGAGIPSTAPGTPTERVWYLCGPGTYANFGTSVTVPDGSVMVASYANSTWTTTVIAINGGAAVSGWKVVDSVASLPSSPEDPSLGWIVDNTVYLYVGEGGDTLSGKYQSIGDFQGPPGAEGPQGPPGNDGISIGDNWTAFSVLSALDGKTSEQKQAMVPDGNAIVELEDILYNSSTPELLGGYYSNTSGTVSAPTSSAYKHVRIPLDGVDHITIKGTTGTAATYSWWADETDTYMERIAAATYSTATRIPLKANAAYLYLSFYIASGGITPEVVVYYGRIQDPVDNLDSHSTIKPLAANQGRVLKEMIPVVIGDGGAASDANVYSASASNSNFTRLGHSATQVRDISRKLYYSIARYNSEHPTAQLTEEVVLSNAIDGVDDSSAPNRRQPSVCVTNNKTIIVAAHYLAGSDDSNTGVVVGYKGPSDDAFTYQHFPYYTADSKLYCPNTPTLVVNRGNNTVYLFYCWSPYKTSGSGIVYRTSTDNGATWSEPTAITFTVPTGYTSYVNSPSNPVILTNGTICVPVYFFVGQKMQAAILYKTSGGSWTLSALTPNTKDNECFVYELGNNTLMLNCRVLAEAGRYYRNLYEYDFTYNNWTQIPQLFNPNMDCQASCVKVNYNANRPYYLMSFPDPKYDVSRTRLTIWQSGSGVDWQPVLRFCDPLTKGYTQLAYYDGKLVVVWETNFTTTTTNEIKMLDLSTLLGGLLTIAMPFNYRGTADGKLARIGEILDTDYLEFGEEAIYDYFDNVYTGTSDTTFGVRVVDATNNIFIFQNANVAHYPIKKFNEFGNFKKASLDGTYCLLKQFLKDNTSIEEITVSLSAYYTDTSSVKQMQEFCSGATALKRLRFIDCATTGITSLLHFSSGANKLEYIDMSGADWSNVTDTSYCFNSCTALRDVIMLGCNTASVDLIKGVLVSRGIAANVRITVDAGVWTYVNSEWVLN